MRDVFEKSLAEDPDDLATHSAYADWLTEQGDPRGEFMQTQLALEDESRPAKERKKLQARERQLLKQHRREWLGELAGVGRGGPAWKFGFSRGWLSSVRVPLLSVKGARVLARAPAAKLLRELVVEGVLFELSMTDSFEHGPDVPEGADSPALFPLVGSPNLVHLRKLQLGETIEEPMLGDDEQSEAIEEEGDAAFVPLLRTLPRLEELRLNGLHWADYSGELFGLETFANLRSFEAYGLSRPKLAKLARNPTLGKLERLVLHARPVPFGSTEEQGMALGSLENLFRSKRLPALTHLRLVRSRMGDDGCRALAASGLPGRLKSLELPLACISDAGARALASCPELANLERLDLSYNRLTEKGIKAVEKVCPNVTADEQFGRPWNDNEEAFFVTYYDEDYDEFYEGTME